MKRLLDVGVALAGLIVLSPILAVVAFCLFLQDGRSPFYVPLRVGRNGRPFRMYKLRSMVPLADRNRVDSTASDDPRITRLGRLVRKLKLDEVPQLWNVLIGDMSLVGPRPNVQRETELYSQEERRLLSVPPGITDFSSIVFADLGEILKGKADPDLAYNQLVRPYKSRLGLLYIDHATVSLNVQLIMLTVLNSLYRQAALDRVARVIAVLGAPPELVSVATRRTELRPAAPPGISAVVEGRARAALGE